MDFKFLQNPLNGKWVVLAPRRAKRPDDAKGTAGYCPFCAGNEQDTEVYRVGGEPGDSNWQIRVVKNRYPFAPVHELIIHSQDHHKALEELDDSQVELILATLKQRFLAHKDEGQVYIFCNHGEQAAESIPHPHTQLVVVPAEVKLDIARLAHGDELSEVAKDQVALETAFFQLFCPKTSQWPDEVWVHPKAGSTYFYEISEKEIADLAVVLKKLIKILSTRHGDEFPYNFYIYPGRDWYLRLIPRDRRLGGFEIGAGIYVNTQDPAETIEFLKENIEKGD